MLLEGCTTEDCADEGTTELSAETLELGTTGELAIAVALGLN